MAQLVEHNLAKVGVAGSSPVVRSKRNSPTTTVAGLFLYLSPRLEPERGASVLGRGCGVVCRECPLWAYHRGHLA